jgi:hypothetical protein
LRTTALTSKRPWLENQLNMEPPPSSTGGGTISKPGLVLYYKRSYTTAEIAAARKREWFTPAFEPPQLLRGNPLP